MHSFDPTTDGQRPINLPTAITFDVLYVGTFPTIRTNDVCLVILFPNTYKIVKYA